MKPAAFDWDKESAPVDTKGGFDWDKESQVAPVGSEQSSPRADEPGVGETILHHGTGGYFADWSDELAGQLSRLDPRLQRQGAAVKMPDGSVKFIGSGDDAAAAGQTLERDELKRTADAHPVAAFLSNMGGSMLRDMALQGVGVPVASLPYSAAVGALSGAGAADNETPGGKAGGAGMGLAAGVGGNLLGTHVVGPAVGYVGRKVMSKIPDAVKKFAEERALKAAGPMLKNYRQLAAQGRIDDLGRDLLDEGVVGFGDDVSAIANKANDRLQSIGQAIGFARDQVDKALPASALPTGKQLADTIEQQIVAKLKASPVHEPYADAVQAMADRFRARGDTPVSLNQLTDWKAELNSIIQHPPDPNFPLQQKQAVAGVLKDAEDSLVQRAAGSPAAAQYSEAKRLYGNLANVADFSADKALREDANRIVSPSDHAFGAVAAAVDTAKGGSAGEASLWAMAMAFANKMARERGNSVAAVTLDALADSAPMQWLKRLPAAQGQKYIAPIAQAAVRGPQALAAAVFALSQQDPDFRAMKEDAEKN
jgi:hypothetical protein